MSDPQNPQNPQNEPTGDAANVPPAPSSPASDVPPPATPPAPEAAPAYAPPAYQAAPAYQAPPAYGGAPGAPVPGKTLGIVALVVVFFASLVGLILGYVAKSQSKKAGVPNTPATVAIILGWIFLVLTIIGVIIFFVFLGVGLNAYNELCSELGSGVYESNGTTITCE